MGWMLQGDWYILEQETRKPFELFKRAASRGLMQGLSGLVTQNVIMELGWFIAYLGRERVAILYQGDPEIPSDISGVLYLEFNERIGEVSERIRRRLRGVGLIS